MEIISICVFLPLTIALLAAAFHEKLRARLLRVAAVEAAEERLSRLERYYWVAFALIMAAGVFARCYRFVELPRGINQDGLMAGTEAYSLLMNGTDQYGTSLPTYFEAWGFSQMSTLYSYLMVPFIRLFGLSKFTLRLPMLLASLAMLPLVWDFARRIAGKGFALSALLMLAVNPWHMVQSRWALEANLMPHVVLTGVYLLYLGKDRRWALYLSMVFFGLAPYAYGVACFSVPVLLVSAAAYYLARRKATVVDVLVCVLIFLVIAGPYFYTMAINAFGWETVQIGPFTLPYFEESMRSRDMSFMQENPYSSMIWNFILYLNTWMFTISGSSYNAVGWAHTMYLFMPPALLWGMYLLWKQRRALAAAGEDGALRDGGMLILLALLAGVVSGLVVSGAINRCNVTFYPLILVGAYALWQMGRRLRTACALMVAMLAVSFAGLNVTYFTDETYQKTVGDGFFDGLYEALTDTWGWDYDRYYVLTVGDEDGAHHTLMSAYVMFAHQIDYRGRSEEIPLRAANGEETDWYFTERYVFTDYADFEPDPMECAVYVIMEGQKPLFDEANYLFTEYGNYIAVYPRYWAE